MVKSLTLSVEAERSLEEIASYYSSNEKVSSRQVRELIAKEAAIRGIALETAIQSRLEAERVETLR